MSTAIEHIVHTADAYVWNTIQDDATYKSYQRGHVTVVVQFNTRGNVVSATRRTEVTATSFDTDTLTSAHKCKRETVGSWLAVRPGNEYRWDSATGRFVRPVVAATPVEPEWETVVVRGQIAELRTAAINAGLVVTPDVPKDNARYSSDYYADATGTVRLRVTWAELLSNGVSYVSELMNERHSGTYPLNDGWSLVSMRTSACQDNFGAALTRIAELGSLVADIETAHGLALAANTVIVEPVTDTDGHPQTIVTDVDGTRYSICDNPQEHQGTPCRHYVEPVTWPNDKTRRTHSKTTEYGLRIARVAAQYGVPVNHLPRHLCDDVWRGIAAHIGMPSHQFDNTPARHVPIPTGKAMTPNRPNYFPGTVTLDKLSAITAAYVITAYQELRGVSDARIVRIVNGHGTHQHSDMCRTDCNDYVDNSDYIVTVEYGHGRFNHAIYSLYRGRWILWAD